MKRKICQKPSGHDIKRLKRSSRRSETRICVFYGSYNWPLVYEWKNLDLCCSAIYTKDTGDTKTSVSKINITKVKNMISGMAHISNEAEKIEMVLSESLDMNLNLVSCPPLATRSFPRIYEMTFRRSRQIMSLDPYIGIGNASSTYHHFFYNVFESYISPINTEVDDNRVIHSHPPSVKVEFDGGIHTYARSNLIWHTLHALTKALVRRRISDFLEREAMATSSAVPRPVKSICPSYLKTLIVTPDSSITTWQEMIDYENLILSKSLRSPEISSKTRELKQPNLFSFSTTTILNKTAWQRIKTADIVLCSWNAFFVQTFTSFYQHQSQATLPVCEKSYRHFRRVLGERVKWAQTKGTDVTLEKWPFVLEMIKWDNVVIVDPSALDYSPFRDKVSANGSIARTCLQRLRNIGGRKYIFSTRRRSDSDILQIINELYLGGLDIDTRHPISDLIRKMYSEDESLTPLLSDRDKMRSIALVTEMIYCRLRDAGSVINSQDVYNLINMDSPVIRIKESTQGMTAETVLSTFVIDTTVDTGFKTVLERSKDDGKVRSWSQRHQLQVRPNKALSIRHLNYVGITNFGIDLWTEVMKKQLSVSLEEKGLNRFTTHPSTITSLAWDGTTAINIRKRKSLMAIRDCPHDLEFVFSLSNDLFFRRISKMSTVTYFHKITPSAFNGFNLMYFALNNIDHDSCATSLTALGKPVCAVAGVGDMVRHMEDSASRIQGHIEENENEQKQVRQDMEAIAFYIATMENEDTVHGQTQHFNLVEQRKRQQELRMIHALLEIQRDTFENTSEYRTSQLEKLKHDFDHGAVPECTICLSDHSSLRNISVLPCSHMICEYCLFSLEKKLCPVCRKALTMNNVVFLLPPRPITKSMTTFHKLVKNQLTSDETGGGKTDPPFHEIDDIVYSMFGNIRKRFEDDRKNQFIVFVVESYDEVNFFNIGKKVKLHLDTFVAEAEESCEIKSSLFQFTAMERAKAVIDFERSISEAYKVCEKAHREEETPPAFISILVLPHSPRTLRYMSLMKFTRLTDVFIHGCPVHFDHTGDYVTDILTPTLDLFDRDTTIHHIYTVPSPVSVSYDLWYLMKKIKFY